MATKTKLNKTFKTRKKNLLANKKERTQSTENNESASSNENIEKVPSQIPSEPPSQIYGEDWAGESAYYLGIGSWPDDQAKGKSISESQSTVLNFLEAGTIISILEDLFDEIVLLKYVIRAPTVSTWDYGYHTLEERFTRKQSAERIFPEVDGVPFMTTPLKLQRDRQFIENVVTKTTKTLLEDGTFEPLLSAAQLLHRRHSEEEALVSEVKQNLSYLKDIRGRVSEKKRVENADEAQRDELLNRLQDEIMDVNFKCAIEEGYINKWEDTRDKQNKWRLRLGEKYFADNLEKIIMKTDLENRVTTELQMFIKNNQLELEEQLEEWMTRYDEEIERKDNRILTLKYQRDQQRADIKRLRQTFRDRKKQMKDWVTFRGVRKKQVAASLIVQAWWRGMMVRKQIGPYKPKKPPGKPPAGKK